MKFFLGIFYVLLLAAALSGCDIAVLDPAGFVAKAQRNLILVSFGIMLCIVLPVMIAVIVLVIKYRATNARAEYLPDWGHSKKIEIYMWLIPICTVIALGILSVTYIFKLEPSRQLPNLSGSDDKILQIDAVALDWRWLFIYPQYGVATINEIYAPTGQQVMVQMTAESVINAFWVPKLGTVLYAMPNMNAKLHLISEKDGIYPGVSANYSGEGFSGMEFKWHSVSKGDFDQWIAKVRLQGSALNRQTYPQLAQKSLNTQVSYFSTIDPDLYYRIVNRCVKEGTQCNEDQMRLAAEKSLWGKICSVFDSSTWD